MWEYAALAVGIRLIVRRYQHARENHAVAERELSGRLDARSSAD
jgi:hypothetical protein